jgi:hypothetical protein
MKKETTKPETKPAAETAVATAAPPAAPVDPVAVLAERKRRKAVEAWRQARKILLQPTLTEADVCRLADLLETAGLPAGLITLFRTADQLRTTATETGAPLERLVGERAEAEAALQQAQATLKQKMAELEAAVTSAYLVLCDAKVKQGAAVDARNLVENLSNWFAPLFDADKGVSDFALPAQLDGLFPEGIRTALKAAGLLDGQQRPTALTQPQPVRTPPARRGPVIECSHGPTMTKMQGSSGGNWYNGQPVDAMGHAIQPTDAAGNPKDMFGRLVPGQVSQ